MTARTDDELKQLARDIQMGRVFTDRHVRPEDGPGALGGIFTVLYLMTQEQLDELAKSGPQMFYEYLDKAGPRSFNGYPSFLSLGVVTAEEWPRLRAYLQALADAPDPLDNVTI